MGQFSMSKVKNETSTYAKYGSDFCPINSESNRINMNINNETKGMSISKKKIMNNLIVSDSETINGNLFNTMINNNMKHIGPELTVSKTNSLFESGIGLKMGGNIIKGKSMREGWK